MLELVIFKVTTEVLTNGLTNLQPYATHVVVKVNALAYLSSTLVLILLWGPLTLQLLVGLHKITAMVFCWGGM